MGKGPKENVPGTLFSKAIKKSVRRSKIFCRYDFYAVYKIRNRPEKSCPSCYVVVVVGDADGFDRGR